MISYHPQKGLDSRQYGRGFKLVDTIDLVRVAKCMTTFTWSPIAWKDGVRTQKNYLGARLCALDFDSGEMSLAQAMQSFCDLRCIIGTTKSHQVNKNGECHDRFRVVIVWQHAINDLRTYRWNMAQIMECYPCDSACRDGARFFYPCKDIVFINTDPDAFYGDVITNVPDSFERYVEPVMHQKYKIIPPKFFRVLEKCYKSGQRNSIVFGCSKDLAKIGMTELEIIETISKHPAYQREPLPLQELHNTVRSALGLAGP